MRRRSLVSHDDVRRAADARTQGIERAAEIHCTSVTAIRRALRNDDEANATRKLLAWLEQPTTEGTNR